MPPSPTDPERPAQRASRRRTLLARAALAVGAIALVAIVVAERLPTRSSIRSDERIVLFATAAHLSGDGRFWEVPIHGWIFEPEIDDATRAAALRALGKSLGLDEQQLADGILEQRLRPFLYDNQRGKRIVIRIGEQRHTVGPSDATGHFSAHVRVPAEQARRLAKGGALTIEALSERHRSGTFVGTVQLVDPTGISVISDIDDTIKVTQVTDRKALIHNTFLRPFRAAEGMPELYRRWASAGARFHYVSSSPWQLYEPLQHLLDDSDFPAATLQLKSFRLKDRSVLDLWANPLQTKPPTIESILAAYPERRFCLVGDSGEKDPEVYGTVARKHPEQIVGIYIRDVTGEQRDTPRYAQAFEGIAPGRWHVFTDPSGLELPTEK